MTTPALQETLDAIHTAAGLDAALLGPQYLAEHSAPPRVVWVPSDDLFDGGRVLVRDRFTPLSVRAGFDVHCWGEDLDATRELRRKLLVALHAQGGASLQVERARWAFAPDPLTPWLADGCAWVVRVTLLEPIPADPYATTTVATVALEPFADAAPGDGQLDATET